MTEPSAKPAVYGLLGDGEHSAYELLQRQLSARGITHETQPPHPMWPGVFVESIDDYAGNGWVYQTVGHIVSYGPDSPWPEVTYTLIDPGVAIDRFTPAKGQAVVVFPAPKIEPLEADPS